MGPYLPAKRGLRRELRARCLGAHPRRAPKTDSVDGRQIARDFALRFRAGRAGGEDPPGAQETDESGPPSSWQDRLLSILQTMDPTAFERLCQRILRESGFIEVDVTKSSGAGGIDGHGTIRLGGLIGFNVLFQSKRYKGNLGPDVVRDFRGAMVGRADKGVIISTGSFTLEARREATRDGAPSSGSRSNSVVPERAADTDCAEGIEHAGSKR